jgi:hypothetical protein
MRTSGAGYWAAPRAHKSASCQVLGGATAAK